MFRRMLRKLQPRRGHLEWAGEKIPREGTSIPVLLAMDSEMTSLLYCQMQNMNLIELWI